jgi:hypothetical protein
MVVQKVDVLAHSENWFQEFIYQAKNGHKTRIKIKVPIPRI